MRTTKGVVRTTKVLEILFPALMVAGALGSLAVNLVDHGHCAVSLQWIGAALLYTALMLRNVGR